MSDAELEARSGCWEVFGRWSRLLYILDVERGLSYPEIVAWLDKFDSVEAALDAAALNHSESPADGEQ